MAGPHIEAGSIENARIYQSLKARLFDVPTEQALAFSILMQAVWYVPTLVVGGGLLLLRLVRTLRASPRGLAVGEAVDG